VGWFTVFISAWWPWAGQPRILHFTRSQMTSSPLLPLQPCLGRNRGEFESARPTALRKPTGPLGRFTIESVRTGARVEAVIDIDTGEPDEPTYLALRHLMRCARTKAEHAMDPRIFQLLYRIGQSTGQKILLISGYRDPIYSTAAFSYHARGMAVDIRSPA